MHKHISGAKRIPITYPWVKPDLLSVWVDFERLTGLFPLYVSLQCDVAFCFTFITLKLFLLPTLYHEALSGGGAEGADRETSGFKVFTLVK